MKLLERLQWGDVKQVRVTSLSGAIFTGKYTLSVDPNGHPVALVSDSMAIPWVTIQHVTEHVPPIGVGT